MWLGIDPSCGGFRFLHPSRLEGHREIILWENPPPMTLHSPSYPQNIFHGTLSLDSFMTFRLQQSNSTTPWTHRHITRNICCDLHAWGYHHRGGPFDFIDFFLFSCLETTVRFISAALSENKPRRPRLSYSARFGASPPNSRWAHVRVTHSLLVFLSHSYTHIITHTYTHTCHTTPKQASSTQVFGGTVGILYHSNTIATLPTAGKEYKKKNKTRAKAVPRRSKR